MIRKSLQKRETKSIEMFGGIEAHAEMDSGRADARLTGYQLNSPACISSEEDECERKGHAVKRMERKRMERSARAAPIKCIEEKRRAGEG